MQPRRDADLPEPYRTWIDTGLPLPETVTLLPRRVDVAQDVLIAVALGLPFAVMGSFWATLLARGFRADAPSLGFLLLAAVTAGLWLVPLVLIRRVTVTMSASKEAKQGRLRQGLLLGPGGLLLRLAPNDCHLILAEEFVTAKERISSKRRPQRYFRIETRYDAVEFFSERLLGDPDDVNRHQKRIWRGRHRSK